MGVTTQISRRRVNTHGVVGTGYFIEECYSGKRIKWTPEKLWEGINYVENGFSISFAGLKKLLPVFKGRLFDFAILT